MRRLCDDFCRAGWTLKILTSPEQIADREIWAVHLHSTYRTETVGRWDGHSGCGHVNPGAGWTWQSRALLDVPKPQETAVARASLKHFYASY